MPGSVVIGPVVLLKKAKMLKVYDDDNSENDGQRTNVSYKAASNALMRIILAVNRLILVPRNDL